jgi:hypothetical protein
MIIDWQDVTGSERIVAMAFVAQQELICVRFPDGVEWCYNGCTPDEYATFSDPATSKGRYINDVLNKKLNDRLLY